MAHALTTGATLSSKPQAEVGEIAFASSCVKSIVAKKLSLFVFNFQSAKKF